MSICLGFYACEGFHNPLKSKDAKAEYVEFTDNATIRMKRSRVLNSVISAMMPHPLRFKQVWHMARGSKSLYAWKAVAPDGFLALGMVCSASGKGRAGYLIFSAC
jgi:hypothetical protein